MNPVETDQSNVRLTLPGGTAANDLPAERITICDPDAPDDPSKASRGFETVWVTDEAEREALAAGAPVVLRVWGDGHPPVSIHVPEIPLERRGLTAEHATRAIGALFAALSDHVDAWAVEAGHEDHARASVVLPLAGDFLTLWEACVAQTPEPAGAVDRLVAELHDQADQAGQRVSAIQRERARRLQAHDGDKIAAAADYAQDARQILGQREAIGSAAVVFDLDDVEVAAMRDLLGREPDPPAPDTPEPEDPS